jgi:alpha-glucoside transport system substrate-binding protein
MKRKVSRLLIAVLAAWTAAWGLIPSSSSAVRAEQPYTADQTVTIVGNWGGTEQADFQAVLDEFTSRTGITVTYTQDPDYVDLLLSCAASATCPDVAAVSRPGLIKELAAQGSLVPLAPIVTDFDLYYSAPWRRLGSVGTTLYGIPFKAGSKSMIWYRPQAFDAIAASVPQNWTQLLGLCADLVADGQTPFALGTESGGASGWTLSDWFENILLRVGGPEVHRKLALHNIPWTDPVVVETMQRFSDIVGHEDYQAGGITGTLTTNFWDAIEQVFGTSSGATMVAQGSWVQGAISSINPLLTPVTDYNFFDFPEIDPVFGKPLMGGGDFVVLLNNASAPQALVQFLASPDAAEIWAVRGGGYLSPNSGVNLALYPDTLTRSQAQQLVDASDFVYDLDDQLPSELQVYEWGALMNFVAHQDQMMSILQGIEAKATELQGLPYKSYLPAVRR